MDQKAGTEAIILSAITISFFSTRIMITSFSFRFFTTTTFYHSQAIKSMPFLILDPYVIVHPDFHTGILRGTKRILPNAQAFRKTHCGPHYIV